MTRQAQPYTTDRDDDDDDDDGDVDNPDSEILTAHDLAAWQLTVSRIGDGCCSNTVEAALRPVHTLLGTPPYASLVLSCLSLSSTSFLTQSFSKVSHAVHAA